VIDVSSDFRLKNPSDYVRYYHYEHPDPDLLDRAGYGLVEWRPWVAKETMLVANPGCYPTATLLALAPVLGAGLHSGAPVVVNALSGVSGAGRAASVKNLFVEVEGAAGAYKIGQEHAHCAEIQQTMRGMCASGASVPSLVFNPHVVPMARGIVATVTVPLVRTCEHKMLLELYREYYRNSVFVRVLEDNRLPQTRDVRFTNRCDMALRTVENGTILVVTSVIDNLLKGAAGQAVQHLNVAEQFPMETGLALCGV
jgi:N-acetyl-gamma-glutamyl-phosphate reductase